jgi:methionyl-tRNA formyltransferase
MRIILITGDNLEHHYVANRLTREIELTAIVVDHGKRVSTSEKYRKYFRRYTPAQIVSRTCLVLLRKIWRDRVIRERTLLSVFGQENCLGFLRPDLLHHVHGINTPESVRLVSSLEPDVILVFGTGIVGGRILSLASTLALNMHTGISPYYRGADCTFWPVHNQELHMLGATVHECTKELDGGRIFGTTRTQLHKDDNLFAVFARCVMAGADLYANRVRELTERTLKGTAQELSVGVEYKAVMRGVRAECRARRSVKAGLIRRFVEGQSATTFNCLGAVHSPRS